MSQLPVDLKQLLHSQLSERYRAVFIQGPAACGKTGYAKRLATSLPAYYCDLLGEFVQKEDQSTIDLFDTNKLLSRLKHQSTNHKILILDNADFLFNTWGDRARREFGETISKLDSIQFPTVLCVFTQEDLAFADVLYSPTSTGFSRNIRFEDLQAI
ncbi:MAG: P-loop NTPase family protein [Armatimonadota bacterium]